MATPHPQPSVPVTLPRITITFCTQCKWLLRAAWLQQELLSTFSTDLGEVALVPSTGGVFTIRILHQSLPSNHETGGEVQVEESVIWDRKADGGFPEAKVLKQRVRDVVAPGRGLGHSDTPGSAKREGGEGGGGGGEVSKEGGGDANGGNVEGGSMNVRNPLVARMRPGVAGGGSAEGGSAKKGGDVGSAEGKEGCEDCS